MANAALLRATAVLDHLSSIQNPEMVELGVFVGMMSRRLLERSDLILYMVDSWDTDHTQDYKDTNDFHAKLTKRQQEDYHQQSLKVATSAPGRATIIRDKTLNAVTHFADHSLDLVFIDADHSYAGCKADIQAWLPKIKPGGWLSGHDYENETRDFKFGVTQAVNEYIAESRKPLELGDNYTWFVRQ
jgi:hypothetical protein